MMKKRFLYKHLALIIAVIMIISNIPMHTFAAETDSNRGKLLNGSFEDPKNYNWFKQVNQRNVPNWNTTAAEGKIEFFEKNTFYIKSVTLTPTEGDQAVELNADEESSLYQIVDTEPSSIYEWGLDHGARTDSDTMALIIGPEQNVAPSKNVGEGYETEDLDYPNPPLRVGKKYGKDQMMQMISWLKATGEIQSFTGTNGISNDGKAIILYSKKFANDGEFENNKDGQPFSMTPSSIYTEKWCIWIMTDSMAKSGDNPWGHYGMNAEGEQNDSEVDLSKKYLYTVPSGQTKTIFSFTSVENAIPSGKSQVDPTFGNFLDNVNFQLYHSLSGSTTAHGSAVVGSSDGTSSGSGATTGHKVTVGNSVATYVTDGETLQVEAIVSKEDKEVVNFVGVYYTVQDPEGNGTITKFISVKNNSDWEQSEDDSGNIRYTYNLMNVTSAVNLHFVFIKSPLITYDSNGGKAYLCTPSGSNSMTEADNVYSFKPTVEDNIEYIEPYTSHEPEGQNDAWKFMGWKLFDDNGVVETETIGENGLLQGVHSIACNYEQNSVEGVTPTQNFVIIGKNDTFLEGTQTQSGKTWSTTANKLYNDKAVGLSLVAQWRWRQTFIPQTNLGSGYSNSSTGGSVNITSATDDDENYDDEYDEDGAKAYYASVGETIQAKAVASEGYFDGWYDEDGNIVSTTSEMSYIETKENVKKYYARFSLKMTQHFKRQIKVNGEWTTIDDNDTSVPVLDHVSMSEGLGTVVSSTATNNSSYGIIGWYDKDGNPVDESMVCNDGKTIRYKVLGDATYYARYVQAVTINFKKQYVQQDGTIITYAGSTYGTVSVENVDAIPGDVVNSKAYPAVGYNFVGWYDGEDENAKSVSCLDASDTKIVTPTATSVNGVTYYARFIARQDTKYQVYHYFINLNGDGKDVLKYTNTYFGTTGELVMPAISQNLSLHTGYIYSSGIPENPEPISANGDKIFKLYYTKTNTTLSYDSNPPEDASISDSVESTAGFVGCEVSVTEDSFACPGYKFNGWNTEADGTGTSYSAKETYMMLSNKGTENPNVLYAQWVPSTSVKYTVQHIKLDSNEAAVGVENYIFYGTTGTKVEAKDKSYEGYTFAADYDKNGKKTITKGNIEGDGSLVLTLYYKPNSTALTYKANGGNGGDFIQSGFVNESVTVNDGNTFTRSGYTFDGWKTPAGTSYSANASYTLTAGENILLAQWKANKNTSYKILHYLVSADGAKATLLNDKIENKTYTTAEFVTASPISIEGYSYKSDFSANGMKTVATGIVAGDGSLVLTLYYLPNVISLTYDANGGVGNSISTSVRVSETVIVEKNTFTRDGYTFAGWNTVKTPAENSETAYAPGNNYTLGTSDSTLYAQWTANTNTKYLVEHYKVNAEGSSADLHSSETLSGTTDTSVVATATNIKGYTYQESYNNNDMITKASGIVTGDGSLVLKLYYTPNLAFLHYYPNGGNGSEDIVSGHVDEKKSVKENSYERDGYSFSGWNTKADGTGVSYEADDEITLTADDNVLYAQWTKIPVQTVETELTYKGNGGIEEDYIVAGDVGEELIVLENMFSYDNHMFIGWNTEEDGSGTTYAMGNTYTLTEYEDVLYAQWEEEPEPPEADTAILIYKPNGADGEDSSVSGKLNEDTVVIPNPYNREDYNFVVWSTTQDLSGTLYSVGSEYKFTEEENQLFAIWEEIPETDELVKLTYVANGGDGLDVSISGILDTDITLISNPFVRDGYEFIGWGTVPAPVEDTQKYDVGGDFTLTAMEQTMYAQWEKISEPPVLTTTLTYKPNGGMGEDFTVKGNVGDTEITLDNMFNREGYLFSGWNTSADGTGNAYAIESDYVLTENENILYAQWEKIPQPPKPPTPITTLTYKANGGKGEDFIVKGTQGENETILENMFSRAGYVFSGWNTKADGSGTSYKIGSKYTLTDGEDMLYAQWAKETEITEEDNHNSNVSNTDVKPGPNKPTTSEEVPKNPDTGDNGVIYLLSFVVLICGLGITLCGRFKKKEAHKN